MRFSTGRAIDVQPRQEALLMQQDSQSLTRAASPVEIMNMGALRLTINLFRYIKTELFVYIENANGEQNTCRQLEIGSLHLHQ
jgi:hypothetical protein